MVETQAEFLRCVCRVDPCPIRVAQLRGLFSLARWSWCGHGSRSRVISKLIGGDRTISKIRMLNWRRTQTGRTTATCHGEPSMRRVLIALFFIAPTGQALPDDAAKDMPLLFSDDFAKGADRW